MTIKPLHFWLGVAAIVLASYWLYNRGYTNGLAAGVKAATT